MGGGISSLKGDATIDMVIPCMTLPNDLFDKLALLSKVSSGQGEAIKMLLTGIAEGLDEMKGKPKTDIDCISSVHDLYIKSQTTSEGLPENFLYFGTNIDSKNLAPFLRSNPFFSMALTSKRDDETGELVFEANTIGEETWTCKLLASLPDDNVFVNALFDKDLNLITIKAINKNGDDLGKDLEYCCTRLLALISFSGSIVHALVHVFHCAMVTGLYTAVESDNKNAIQGWASQFYPMVWMKYEEVHLLLLDGENRFMGFENGRERKERMQVLEDIFKLWGNCKTADNFMDRFILEGLLRNASKEELATSDILTEFSKHASLVSAYTSELMNAFELADAKVFNTINTELLNYFNAVGDGNVLNMETLGQWTELMSVTGIFHGASVSKSRFRASASFNAQNTPGDTWSVDDVKLISVGLGTICGLQEGHQVFSSSNFPEEVRELFTARIRHVLLKYDAMRSAYQSEYFERISKRDDYAEIGWILNDWVLDGIDGRQLTVTTYV